MTVHYEWDDEDDGFFSKKDMTNRICSLSGEPVQLPFMDWNGHGDAGLIINAASLAGHNPVGFLHDVIELLHVVQRLSIKERREKAREGMNKTLNAMK